MITKKALLALLLLFSYSIGFSHYLIPHCESAHEMDASHQSEGNGIHFHQHHDLNEETLVDQDEEHKHFQHEGHIDEGIYDFLVCFLSEVEHPETENGMEGFIPESTDQVFSSSENEWMILASINGLMLPYLFVHKKELNDNKAPEFYHSPPILFSPNKGPPIISC